MHGVRGVVTGTQLPTLPATLQDSHWPSQGLSQQLPCAQWPVPHSASTLHPSPMLRLTQVPLLQTGVFPVQPPQHSVAAMQAPLHGRMVPWQPPAPAAPPVPTVPPVGEPPLPPAPAEPPCRHAAAPRDAARSDTAAAENTAGPAQAARACQAARARQAAGAGDAARAKAPAATSNTARAGRTAATAEARTAGRHPARAVSSATAPVCAGAAILRNVGCRPAGSEQQAHAQHQPRNARRRRSAPAPPCTK